MIAILLKEPSMRLFLFLLIPFLLFAEGSVKKVVYDLTTGDQKTLEFRLISGLVQNKTAFADQLDELEAAVIIHGDSYKFFVKNAENAELGKRLRSLAETYGVTFLMCDVGRKKRQIPLETLYDFVKITPSASFGLINLQNDGYAYLPIR